MNLREKPVESDLLTGSLVVNIEERIVSCCYLRTFHLNISHIQNFILLLKYWKYTAQRYVNFQSSVEMSF